MLPAEQNNKNTSDWEFVMDVETHSISFKLSFESIEILNEIERDMRARGCPRVNRTRLMETALLCMAANYPNFRLDHEVLNSMFAASHDECTRIARMTMFKKALEPFKDRIYSDGWLNSGMRGESAEFLWTTLQRKDFFKAFCEIENWEATPYFPKDVEEASRLVSMFYACPELSERYEMCAFSIEPMSWLKRAWPRIAENAAQFSNRKPATHVDAPRRQDGYEEFFNFFNDKHLALIESRFEREVA